MKEERKMEIQIKALKLYKKSIVVQKQEAVIISNIFYLNFWGILLLLKLFQWVQQYNKLYFINPWKCLYLCKEDI